jgi:hypothetical protein
VLCVDTKRCTICGESKARDQYYAAKGMSDGLRSECKDCNRRLKRERYAQDPERYIQMVQRWQEKNPERLKEYRKQRNARPEVKRRARDAYYRRTHGISADDFDRMLAEQNGRCAICGRAPEREAAMHVDHDHLDGHVRGLLCIDCNQGIGKLREDPSILLRAVVYLRQRSAAPVGSDG